MTQAWTYRIAKRIVDLALAGPALLLTAPIQLVAMIAIRVTSPGPAVFRQERVGLGGQPFTVYKLRTMYTGCSEDLHRSYVLSLLGRASGRPDEAETTTGEAAASGQAAASEQAAGGPARHDEGAGQSVGHVGLPADPSDVVTAAPEKKSRVQYKIQQDPRVTRVGALLRSTSIDELPQLVNVLKGEMSLVGPRPDLPYIVATYEDWQRRRLDALPGLTGLWQVSGRGNLSPADMLRLDVQYVEQACLSVDLRIIAKTIPSLIGRVGAK